MSALAVEAGDSPTMCRDLCHILSLSRELQRTLKFTGAAKSLADTSLALSHLRAWHEAIEARFLFPVCVKAMSFMT